MKNLRDTFLKLFLVDQATRNKVNDKVWDKFKDLKKQETLAILKYSTIIVVGFLLLFHWPIKFMIAVKERTEIVEMGTVPIFNSKVSPMNGTSLDHYNSWVHSHIRDGASVWEAVSHTTECPCDRGDERCAENWAVGKIDHWAEGPLYLKTNTSVSAAPRVSSHLGFIDISAEEPEGLRYLTTFGAMLLYYSILGLIWVALVLFIEENINKALGVNKKKK